MSFLGVLNFSDSIGGLIYEIRIFAAENLISSIIIYVVEISIGCMLSCWHSFDSDESLWLSLPHAVLSKLGRPNRSRKYEGFIG